MKDRYQFIDFEIVSGIFCVHLQRLRVEDRNMDDLGAELARLVDEENCKKMVLCLGPEEPEFLISVFLAKIINLQRRLDAMGGAFVLACVSDYTRHVFRVAGIEKFFRFFPDQDAAVQALTD